MEALPVGDGGRQPVLPHPLGCHWPLYPVTPGLAVPSWVWRWAGLEPRGQGCTQQSLWMCLRLCLGTDTWSYHWMRPNAWSLARPHFLPGPGLVILQDLALQEVGQDSGSTCNCLKIMAGSCKHFFPGRQTCIPSHSVPPTEHPEEGWAPIIAGSQGGVLECSLMKVGNQLLGSVVRQVWMKVGDV